MSEQQKYDFPTEVIELPSKGLLYPKDHPLSSGTIEIKYMTAKEEDILASPNLIKKGIVLDKLFESIIVDKSINPNDIIIGDKNAIVLATRLLGYGPEYTMRFYSKVLNDAVETTVDLSKVKIKEIDTSVFKNQNRFEFETPAGKNKLVFKILTHGDETAIERDIQAIEKVNKDASIDITTRLRYMILSVDGKEDVGTISRYVQNMLVRDTRALRDYVKSITPDVDMSVEYEHEDGTLEVVPITMGVTFFWPSA